MNEEIFLWFNGWGILFCALCGLFYVFSHWFMFYEIHFLEHYSKVVGFVCLIVVPFVSGWKALLLSFPICMIISFVGMLILKMIHLDEFNDRQSGESFGEARERRVKQESESDNGE
jgi:hypothetical protein